MPFLHARGYKLIPQKRSVIFSAFTDTRALSGVVIFSITLLRLGNLSESYYRQLISALITTADEMSNILRLFDVTIPQIAALSVVFVSVAWLFAFVRKMIRLMRFTVYLSHQGITVTHGIITLYEYTLVQNDLPPITCCDTLSTLVTGAAPLYCGKRMIFTAADISTRNRLLKKLLGASPPKRSVTPPPQAMFGHCAAPLGWLAATVTTALLLWAGEHYGMIGYSSPLRSVLWLCAAVSLWYALTYAVYMLHSFVSAGKYMSVITHRRTARLYTVYIPQSTTGYYAVTTNPFQRRSQLCDAVITSLPHSKLKLRNVQQSRTNRMLNTAVTHSKPH